MSRAITANHMIGSTVIAGDVTELTIAVEMLKRGIRVSKPLTSDCPYDLVADISGVLYRIQAKTSHKVTKTSFAFSTKRTYRNNTRISKRAYADGEIDFFATVFDGRCYVVPYSDCKPGLKRLHVRPPANNQKMGIAMADDYALENMLEKITRDSSR